eukprot:TRINITY_DN3595_c0_g1_i1.p1 TRINITY_DN3595_c0_g1~~TRINITY_DN3595_c0_g1_i1.p1  ORF type:complete len:82 (+),score=51.92 TRINITY_DN3595_c0_g1_i1:57-302(+)
MAGGGFKLTSELIPLFVVVGAGVALAGYAGVRTLANHNDIVINKGQPYQYQTRNSDKFVPRETILKHYTEKHPEIKKPASN